MSHGKCKEVRMTTEWTNAYGLSQEELLLWQANSNNAGKIAFEL